GFPGVSIPLVIGASIFTGVMFLLFLIFALRAQQAPIQTGQESLVGRTGLARTDLNPGGIVQVGGESWTARLCEGHPPIPRGQRVEVVEVRGLRLIVRSKG